MQGKKLAKQEIVNFLEELANIYNDRKMEDSIRSAELLHANSFHNFMDKTQFEYHKNRTIKLLKKLTLMVDEKIKTI
mgnify:CR=1 FL=1